MLAVKRADSLHHENQVRPELIPRVLDTVVLVDLTVILLQELMACTRPTELQQVRHKTPMFRSVERVADG